MGLKLLSIALIGLVFLSCDSTPPYAISFREIECNSSPLFLIDNTNSEVYGKEDSIYAYFPICFEIKNNTGKEVQFSYRLAHDEQRFPIAQISDSVFINMSYLDEKGVFKLREQDSVKYTVFYETMVPRSKLKNIQLIAPKQLNTSIKYVSIDSINDYAISHSTLVVNVEITEGEKKYNLYYYTKYRKYLIIDYNAVIKYGTEKKDSISVLTFSKTDILNYEGMNKFSVENYKRTINNQVAIKDK